MAATPFAVRNLEQHRVSPPPGSVAADTFIPLTFLDLIWIYTSPVERLLFYHLPQPTSHFVNTLLPKLKRSLSLTLQHFYPLAGTLRPCPDDSTRHEIHHKPGDSVSLTLAECDGDFGELVGNQPRDLKLFLPLVPHLHRVGTMSAVMALQVTVFPNSGICIGVSTHHTVCDGSGSTYFLKSWASACRLEKEATPVAPAPIHDRALICDPDGLYTTIRNECQRLIPILQEGEVLESHTQASVVLFSTFLLRREHIEGLKNWVLSRQREGNAQIKFSTFVVTCACAWVCLTRAQGKASSSSSTATTNNNAEASSYFAFSMDARARLQRQIPTTYLGNCLVPCFVEVPRSALMAEDGVSVASEAIRRGIKAVEEDALRGAGEWVARFVSWAPKGVITVAGSPRFGVYEIDFGWGRPLKVEVISIGGTGAMSLTESREEKGGVEIGLALPQPQMEEFEHHFANVLKNVMDGD